MKILKDLIAVSLANAVLLIAIIEFGPQISNMLHPNTANPSSATDSSLSAEPLGVGTNTPTNTPISAPTEPTSLKKVVTTKPAASTNTINTLQNDPATQPSSTQAPAPDVTPTTAPAATTAPAVTDNRCLIQIDGATYDVSAFQNIHSGGNIFTCGTDMSSNFWSKHNQRTLNQMGQYKI